MMAQKISANEAGEFEDNTIEQTKNIKFILTMNSNSENSLQIQFDKEDNADIYYDEQKIKKHLLHANHKAASKNNKRNLRLQICKFYGGEKQMPIPIHSQKNYTYLITAMIDKGDQIIHINGVSTIEMDKLQSKRKRQDQLEFDSDGSVESAEDELILTVFKRNRPRFDKYKGDGHIRCAFCDKTNYDKQSMRRLGSFYGPFDKNKFVHLLCVLWTHVVYLNEQLKLVGVEKALKISEKETCVICNKMGPSLMCHMGKCKQKAHYECAQIQKWKFSWIDYHVYCPSCGQLPVKNKNKKKL